MTGFSVTGHDNGSHAFFGRNDLTRCDTCGELLDKWRESLVGLRIKKRKLDISSTYDGVDVVSKRFIEVCQNADLRGLSFTALPDDPEFFQLTASACVEMDLEKSTIRFIDRCTTCGRWESVVGPLIVLKEGATIPERAFVRSDIEFASGDEKSPLILCDHETGTILREAKLKGLCLEPF